MNSSIGSIRQIIQATIRHDVCLIYLSMYSEFVMEQVREGNQNLWDQLIYKDLILDQIMKPI